MQHRICGVLNLWDFSTGQHGAAVAEVLGAAWRNIPLSYRRAMLKVWRDKAATHRILTVEMLDGWSGRNEGVIGAYRPFWYPGIYLWSPIASMPEQYVRYVWLHELAHTLTFDYEHYDPSVPCVDDPLEEQYTDELAEFWGADPEWAEEYEAGTEFKRIIAEWNGLS